MLRIELSDPSVSGDLASFLHACGLDAHVLDESTVGVSDPSGTLDEDDLRLRLATWRAMQVGVTTRLHR